MLLTDDLEIQDLKDCLMIEQEEKNELSRKIQELEKECECVIAFIFFVQIVSSVFEWCLFVHSIFFLALEWWLTYSPQIYVWSTYWKTVWSKNTFLVTKCWLPTFKTVKDRMWPEPTTDIVLNTWNPNLLIPYYSRNLMSSLVKCFLFFYYMLGFA